MLDNILPSFSDRIPIEIWAEICVHCDTDTVERFRRASKRFHTLLSNRAFQIKYFLECEFPKSLHTTDEACEFFNLALKFNLPGFVMDALFKKLNFTRKRTMFIYSLTNQNLMLAEKLLPVLIVDGCVSDDPLLVLGKKIARITENEKLVRLFE